MEEVATACLMALIEPQFMRIKQKGMSIRALVQFILNKKKL